VDLLATFDTGKLRNIVLLSHRGAGKTMIAESMLLASGVINRLGRTEDGTTASDYEPEETKRTNSIQTSILPCPWNGHKINVLDTPGYADFRGEVISGAQAADGAVIVVAAQAGIEVGTQQMWQIAEDLNLPKIIVINKMDRENSDFQGILDSLSETFGRQCVGVHVPIGSEESFSGLVNLLSPDPDVPEGMETQVEMAHERLVEVVAESDDALATKYLEGEELSTDELVSGLKAGVKNRTIVPVMLSSATSNIGTTELLDVLIDLIPSPDELPGPTATDTSSGDPVNFDWDANGVMAALVFKTTADPFVGKLSYVKVLNGTFNSDSQLINASKNESERVAQVLVVTGKSQESTVALAPGDIGAVAKLNSALTGDTLSSKETPLVLPRIDFPNPVYQMAAFPTSKADTDKMSNALARITEEDPCLSVTREPDTYEVLLGGLGDTHIDVTVEKMKRKFGVDISLQTPKVPYMETVSTPTRVEYRHKKQSGGHGQFAHVWLEIEPLGRGSGFKFNQKVVGGSVPKEYIPSVEKGCLKALRGGVLGGFPIVDLKATLVDGSFHPVDSSGVSFEIAGGHALSDGIKDAGPVLLEPLMHVQVFVPESDTGEVMGDLNSKRARILGMNPLENGSTAIEAEVPQAEMLRYATELRSQTQGRGSFTISFDHYDEVPGHLVQNIIEAIQEREKVEA